MKLINQFTIDSCTWYHIAGSQNPADVITRGCDAASLKENKLWWHGPWHSGAQQAESNVNIALLSNHILDVDLVGQGLASVINPAITCTNVDFSTARTEHTSSELSLQQLSCNKVESRPIWPFLTKYSSFTKMQNIMSYMLRFINKCKHNILNNSAILYRGVICAKERRIAIQTIVRCTQLYYFSNEIVILGKNEELKNNLASLHPYLDSDLIMRVGGRLQRAEIPFAQKHPMILPSDAHVTNLVIQLEHLTMLHSGLKLTLASLLQRYWIVSATRQIKRVIHKCLKCFRLKCDNAKQLMGTLPTDRVTPARPFQKIGIDYCGPFQVKQSRIRSSIISKGYIAVFVCFSTKAVHLELVSDMTTQCFLAAFKRFCSRRGYPSDATCDNAGTFKGAGNELKALYELHRKTNHESLVLEYASQKEITFHYAPSYSPNFQGLVESAVKSAKYHFKRIIGSSPYTYEEFNTIIIQIEGILNSRPITELSSDASEYHYLSPGHFLVGAGLSSYPEQTLIEVPTNRLTYWRRCTQIQQHFWRVWSGHYLSLLNQRTKWLKTYPNLREGMLVLLKYDNMPSLQWPVGRISKVFVGPDQKVRVVEVTSKTGTYCRAISKIVILPIND